MPHATLPFDADGDKAEYGGVETEDEDVSVQTTKHITEQPASVEHELDNIRHPDYQDEQVGHRQVNDEQVRHGMPHLLVRQHDDNDKSVADNANDADQAEEARYGDKWDCVDREGRCSVGAGRVLHAALPATDRR